MVLSILDNILLGLLKRFRGDTFEERVENFGFLFFYSGVALAFFGSVLTLAPMFIATTLVLFGTTNIDLSWTDSFVRSGLIQGIANFVIAGVCLLILGFLLTKHLQGIIKKHAYIESTKIEEKEIYPLESETEVSIYTETLRGAKTIVSAKEPFSIKELDSFKDRKIFIEASKEGEKKVVRGGKAEFVLTNKDEITKLNIPKKALSYKIEKILLTKKVTQRICGFIKEETTSFYTKVFLSASPDEDMLKKLKNQKELDALLRL